MKTIWIWSNVVKTLVMLIVVCAIWLAACWALSLDGDVSMLGGFIVGMASGQVGLIFWKPWEFE